MDGHVPTKSRTIIPSLKGIGFTETVSNSSLPFPDSLGSSGITGTIFPFRSHCVPSAGIKARWMTERKYRNCLATFCRRLNKCTIFRATVDRLAQITRPRGVNSWGWLGCVVDSGRKKKVSGRLNDSKGIIDLKVKIRSDVRDCTFMIRGVKMS